MMRRSTVLTLAGLAVLAAGCSLAPSYETPPLPVPAQYPGASTPATGADNTTAWCPAVPDPALKRLIGVALAGNRDLRIAAVRIEEARAAYGVQRSSRLPPVSLEGATTLPAVGSQESHQLGVSLPAYEIDFFGKVKNLSEAALQEYLATEQARSAARIALVAEVARGYVVERTALARIALANRVLASRSQATDVLKRRVEAGLSSPLDLEQARVLVAAARSDLNEQTLAEARARNALALLTGYADAQAVDAVARPSAAPLNDDWGRPRAGMPSELLALRPDIVAAEHRLKAANAQIGVARAAFFPSIRLTAQGGFNSTELASLLTAGSLAGQLGPQVSLPIFDGGRNEANLDLARTRETLAVAEYERTVQQAFREVADALSGLALLDRDVADRRATLDTEARRLTLTTKRYHAGAVGHLDVVDAERGVFAAEQALLESRRARLENTIGFYRALGGCGAVFE